MPKLNPDTSWRLVPGVHATSVDDDLVFLDVCRDAYVCLPDGTHLAELGADGRSINPLSDIANDLRNAGLIEIGASSGTDARIRWVVPTQCALLDRYPGIGWRDVGLITQTLQTYAVGYRPSSFVEIISAAREQRTGPARLSSALLDAARDFQRWIPYAPLSGKCLLRSYLLLRFLRRRGLDADWVFGVRLWPFDAHCWLQCEDFALDEQPDRIRAFTPIMVV